MRDVAGEAAEGGARDVVSEASVDASVGVVDAPKPEKTFTTEPDNDEDLLAYFNS